jgi:hypothetical protein
MFDKTYETVDEKDYPNGIADVERAMIEKTPIYLKKSLVSGAAIAKVEPFGNAEYGTSPTYSLEEGFERASLFLDSKKHDPVDPIKEEIREKLRGLDGDKAKKEAYLKEVRRYRENGKELTPDQAARAETITEHVTAEEE